MKHLLIPTLPHKIKCACVLLLLFISSCASFNDAMTPSAKLTKDKFDGSILVTQKPVSSSSSISESWHTMGFDWSSTDPNRVYITIGISGIENITGVKFNVDGEIYDNIKAASSTTEYGDWSTRRFVMGKASFITLTKAKSVKMRVSQINTYSVSSFGTEAPAIVNSKFEQFITLINEHAP